MAARTVTVEQLCKEGVLAPPMDGNHGAIHPKTADYVPSGIPFIMASDLRDGRIDTTNCAFISEAQAASLRKGFAKSGDVLLSHKATIGRRAIVGEIDTPYIMLTPQITYYRVLDEDILDRRYLYYYFGSREFLPVFEQWAGAGSTRAYLGITGQKKLPIILPDIDTQRSIANVAGSLDDKIELNRRMNETLEAIAQAIFRDWFVDFGPTRRKLDGTTDPVAILGGMIPTPEKAAPLAALFPATFGDDGLPEGWSQKPLEEIAEQEKASVKPQDAPNELFEHFSIPAFDSGKSPAMDLGETIKSNKTLIPEGAVLLSKLNPEIQRVWLPRKKDEHRQICSTEFLVYTPREPFGRAYLYSQFSERGFRDLLAGMVTGTSKSHQRVAPKALATRLVTAPEEDPVRAFEEIASPLLDRVLHNQAENNSLAATRDLLLPKLMSGEIRLRDVEAVA